MITLAWLLAATSSGAWSPPLGIPAPPFGIREVAPPSPDPWSAEVPRFYYVDARVGTDQGRSQGTPNAPRATIPSTLPPGSVVILAGPYDAKHESGILANGTAESPVFIRGTSAAVRPKIRGKWALKGSYYILEYLDAEWPTTSGNGKLLITGSYGVVRHCDLRGDGATKGIGGVIVYGSYLVVWDTKIHDSGDVAAHTDDDTHGISVPEKTSYLWVLDSELYKNGGDGIQINAGSLREQASTHHVYVGRNKAYRNKQTGFWVKQAVDVIFSENEAFAHRPSGSSSGQCMGLQYAPERVWFLFNHIHDCDYGIYLGSNSDMGSGQDSYFIGNLIHDIHARGPFNPGSAWSSAAIMAAGGVHRFIINNTIDDVDAGINVPGGGTNRIANNIVFGVTQTGGHDVFIEDAATARAATINHNLFGAPARFRWASAETLDLRSFRSASGQCASCREGNPEWGPSGSGDFHPKASSPAVDGGVLDDAYATFLKLYAIDIARDIEGNARPNGSGWDLGCYERPGR